jgi:hypothetical protein
MAAEAAPASSQIASSLAMGACSRYWNQAPILEVYRPVLARDQQAWRLAQMTVPFLQQADYNSGDSWLWAWQKGMILLINH